MSSLEKALTRRIDYHSLPAAQQWEIDVDLGIGDWDPTPDEKAEYARRRAAMGDPFFAGVEVAKPVDYDNIPKEALAQLNPDLRRAIEAGMRIQIINVTEKSSHIERIRGLLMQTRLDSEGGSNSNGEGRIHVKTESDGEIVLLFGEGGVLTEVSNGIQYRQMRSLAKRLGNDNDFSDTWDGEGENYIEADGGGKIYFKWDSKGDLVRLWFDGETETENDGETFQDKFYPQVQNNTSAYFWRNDDSAHITRGNDRNAFPRVELTFDGDGDLSSFDIVVGDPDEDEDEKSEQTLLDQMLGGYVVRTRSSVDPADSDKEDVESVMKVATNGGGVILFKFDEDGTMVDIEVVQADVEAEDDTAEDDTGD